MQLRRRLWISKRRNLIRISGDRQRAGGGLGGEGGVTMSSGWGAIKKEIMDIKEERLD